VSVTKSYSLAFFASVAAFGASAVATACFHAHALRSQVLMRACRDHGRKGL